MARSRTPGPSSVCRLQVRRAPSSLQPLPGQPGMHGRRTRHSALRLSRCNSIARSKQNWRLSALPHRAAVRSLWSIAMVPQVKLSWRWRPNRMTNTFFMVRRGRQRLALQSVKCGLIAEPTDTCFRNVWAARARRALHFRSSRTTADSATSIAKTLARPLRSISHQAWQILVVQTALASHGRPSFR